jgi:hypothetical protein
MWRLGITRELSGALLPHESAADFNRPQARLQAPDLDHLGQPSYATLVEERRKIRPRLLVGNPLISVILALKAGVSAGERASIFDVDAI